MLNFIFKMKLKKISCKRCAHKKIKMTPTFAVAKEEVLATLLKVLNFYNQMGDELFLRSHKYHIT